MGLEGSCNCRLRRLNFPIKYNFCILNATCLDMLRLKMLWDNDKQSCLLRLRDMCHRFGMDSGCRGCLRKSVMRMCKRWEQIRLLKTSDQRKWDDIVHLWFGSKFAFTLLTSIYLTITWMGMRQISTFKYVMYSSWQVRYSKNVHGTEHEWNVNSLPMWSDNNIEAGKSTDSLNKALMMLMFTQELTFAASTQ